MLKNIVENRLIKNVIGNYVLKVISILLTYIVTPLYMNYFSSNKLLGMWFAIVSIVSWVILLDFGVGASVRNRLVAAINKNDNDEIDKIFTSGLFVNTVIIFFLISVQFVVFELIDCHGLFGVSYNDISERDLKNIMHILCIGVLLRIYGSFLSNVYYSMQKAMASSIMTIASNLIITIYMIIQTKYRYTDSIVLLAAIHAVAYNIPIIVAFFDIFYIKFKNVRFHVKSITRECVENLTKTGLHFFCLQLLITIAFGTKELLITRLIGAEYVVEYNIYQKLVGVASTIFGLALVPVWSEVTERYIKREYTRVFSLYKKGLKFIGIISIGQIVLVILFPIINDLWLGDKAVSVSIYSLIVFSLYNIAYMVVMLNYNFLCGMEKLGKLSIMLLLIVILGIGLSVLLTINVKNWNLINIAIMLSCIPAIVVTSHDIIKSCKV